MKRLAAPAAAILTLLALAGCAPGPDSAAEVAGSPATSPSAPAYVAGEVVDAATAEAMADAREEPYRGYPMLDGSFIIVDRDAPLPEAVQQDVNARGEAVVQQYPRVEVASGGAAAEARSKLAAEIGEQTGKQAIVVTRMAGFDYYENPVTTYFTTGAHRTPQTNAPRSREEVAALIDAFLVDKNPDDYVVIWPN